MTTTGSNSDKIYGLVQCRGYVSAQDCGTCIKGAVNETFNDCKNSNYAAVWFRWRFLRYSKEYFYGQLDSLIRGMSWDQYTTSTDDPTVVTTCMNFMRQLTAEVPDHPFMFKTGSVRVGQKGKRYGFVQCNRDLSKSVCGDCLTSLADFFNQLTRDGISVQSRFCLRAQFLGWFLSFLNGKIGQGIRLCQLAQICLEDSLTCREYGELLLRCGLIGEALKVFEDLELWDNLIYCYCLLEKKLVAVELINARLSVTPHDPRLWCSLGDVTNDDSCFEKALEVSNDKSTRAKRSLARSAYERGDYEESKVLWLVCLWLVLSC
ncbi:hypothetical protein QQ045_013604 [Rhodiola kirilowii]